MSRTAGHKCDEEDEEVVIPLFQLGGWKILISEFSRAQHYVGACTISRAATLGWASADLIHVG